MLAFTEKLLSRVRWTRRDVADFLGRYLSAPKPHVVFRRSAARGHGVRLDARSQLLYRGERFFLNGEAFSVPKRALPGLKAFADQRASDLERLAQVGTLIGQWQQAGYVHYTNKVKQHG
jgi:50S ribosomal protein L16 3-hydroxylase